ncbi:MAG: hypothetical protein KDD44_02295 [Bdellovibrionales bacterium]|nr:hypothetical protein [Bdellovibrionales bacterium]
MDYSVVRLIGGNNPRDRHGLPLAETADELAAAIMHHRQLALDLAPRPVSNGMTALSHCGIIFEEVVRQWLEEQGFVLDPRRTLYHFEQTDEGVWRPVVREVDAVCVDPDQTPQIFVEVKVSVQGMPAVWKKHGSLFRSIALVEQRWPNLKPLVIFVRVGPEVVRTEPRWLVRRGKLSHGALRIAHRYVKVPRVALDLRTLWSWAVARGWSLHPSILEHALAFAEDRALRRGLVTPPDEQRFGT